jgi:hypothetical protein
MIRPVDAVRAFHNAFRNDMKGIDTAAVDAARGIENGSAAIERFRFFNEVLVWHASGEESAIFPRLEEVAPLVAESYVKDHRGLDSAFDRLERSYSRHDRLETARATAAFRFHLMMHLGKEDSHLYRIFEERVPLPEQGTAVSLLASHVPPERFPEVVTWLFPLIGQNDRENMVRILQMSMPPDAFSSTLALIREATGSGWDELARRIPGLDSHRRSDGIGNRVTRRYSPRSD